MLVACVLGVAGLILLAVAADHLVLGASRLATRLRLSSVVIGVVVIGLGTSAPEFLVSGLAAYRGDGGIALGNLIGSNIANLSLVLGVAAVILPINVTSSVIRREVRLAIAAVAVFAVVVWYGITLWTGAGLAVLAVGAVALLIWWARDGAGQSEVGREAREFTSSKAPLDVPVAPAHVPAWAEVVRAVAGLGGVLVGAQLLVVNAASIATRLGVAQSVIGLTLVAIGTSVPELVTTIAAQRRRESDLVIGNLFGSNLSNSLIGGGLVGLAGRGGTLTAANWMILSAMVIITLLAFVMLRGGLRLNRVEGASLLVAYVAAMLLALTV